jgi:hypothetical protein
MFLRPFMCAVLWALAVVSPALAGDIFPPPWPRDPNDPKKTFQCWTFPTPMIGGLPDPGWYNQHQHQGRGPSGPRPIPGPTGTGPVWVPDFAGRAGVWCIPDGAMLEFDIPNWYMPPPFQKELWIQIKYFEILPIVDVLYPSVMGGTFPDLSRTAGLPIIDVPIGPTGGWRQGVWHVVLPFCPDFEVLKLTAPPMTEVYIDQVCIDTWCVPAPGAAALLALGLIGASRRRR